MLPLSPKKNDPLIPFFFYHKECEILSKAFSKSIGMIMHFFLVLDLFTCCITLSDFNILNHPGMSDVKSN